MKKILLIAFLCLQSSGFCAEVFLVDQHLIPVRPSSDTLPVSTVSKVLGRYKKEVDRLTRRGVPISWFRLGDDPRLERFLDAMARRNGGRVFAADGDRLGDYVVTDYVRARKGRRRSA